MQQRTRITVLVGTGIVAAALLAGCSSGGTGTPTETATATETVTASPTTAPSSAGASSPGATTPAGASGAGTAGTARCAAGSLRVGEEAGSGGAAGSTYTHLTLENTGSATCTLQGWPGVSFVGNGTGKQIGAAATQDRSSAHPTVTLAPGQVAVAPLKVTNAQDYPAAKCDPVTPDGLRVYPPGSKQSLYLKTEGYTACAASDVDVLEVQGLVAEGQAAD